MHKCSATGAWSISGKLYPGSTGAINVQCSFNNDPRNDIGLPRPANQYTVQFYVEPAFPFSGPDDSFIHVKPIAEIQWAAGGNSIKRVVDIGDAIAVSGDCDHVSVRVYDNTPTGMAGPQPDKPYLVTILVTPGTRPGNFPVVLRAFPGTVELDPTTSSSVIVIPPNSGITNIKVDIVNESGGSTSWGSVLFLDWTGATIGGFTPANVASGWVPIPPTAVRIKLQNNGVAGSGKLLFTTMFGVDG